MKTSITITLLLILSCNYNDSSNTRALDLGNSNLLTIPERIYSMNDLESLNLGNGFTICPPLSALGDLDSKSEDKLNNITEISDKISQLQNLKVLNLCANDLKSLPNGLLKLRKLDTLDISFNQHLRISQELKILGRMTWLKYLNIFAVDTTKESMSELRQSLPKTKIVASIIEFRDSIGGINE